MGANEDADERFRLVFETSPDAIVITKLSDGCIVDVNGGFERITGWSRAEALGRTTADLGLWVDPELRAQVAERIARDGGVDNLEASFVDRHGHHSEGLFSARLMTLSGEPHLLSTSRDVGALARARREREEALAQLRHAQKAEAVARLAGGVAHDFNNLLTVVLSGVCLAEEVVDDPELLELLATVRGAATRGAGVTRQLLAVSRRSVTDPQPVVLGDAVQQLLPLLQRLLPPGVALSIVSSTDERPTLLDRGQLDQVIMNLVINARDAVGDTGTVTVRTYEQRGDDRDHVVLDVEDDGPGFDPEVRDRVFEPFFTTKPAGVGTGLGLSVVDGIVRQCGGFATLGGEPGRGARVRLHFPVTGLELREGAVASRPPPVVGPRNILLVEDDAALRWVVAHALRRAGHHVLPAAGVDEALQLLDASPLAPDLLLSDVQLGGRSAVELVDAVRRRHPNLPVWLMSGNAEPQLPPDLSARLLAKPFELSELLAAVRAALEEG